MANGNPPYFQGMTYSNLFTLDSEGELQRELMRELIGNAAWFANGTPLTWRDCAEVLDHFAAWGLAADASNMDTREKSAFHLLVRLTIEEKGVEEQPARNIAALVSDCCQEIGETSGYRWKGDIETGGAETMVNDLTKDED